MMRRGFPFVAALVIALPALAAAQDTARLPGDSVVARIVRAPLAPDGTRILPGVLHYEVIVTGDSGVRTIGSHTIAIAEAAHGGRAAWQVAEHRESHPPLRVMTAVDTVVVDRLSLAPLRWDATAANGRFVAAIAGDTMYGGTSGPGVRRTFVTPLAPLTITSEAALDLVLRGSALHPGWVADAVMAVVDLGGPRLLGLRLQVEREERVEVPAGQFDVWAVTARSGTAEKWLWVDKRSGIVVRTAQSPASMPGMILERVLAREP